MSMAGKTFPAFPGHAQPAFLRIWWDAHVTLSFTGLAHAQNGPCWSLCDWVFTWKRFPYYWLFVRGIHLIDRCWALDWRDVTVIVSIRYVPYAFYHIDYTWVCFCLTFRKSHIYTSSLLPFVESNIMNVDCCNEWHFKRFLPIWMHVWYASILLLEGRTRCVINSYINNYHWQRVPEISCCCVILLAKLIVLNNCLNTAFR